MDDNTSEDYSAIVDLLFDLRLSVFECLEEMRSILEKNRGVLLEQDAEGRTLLHWAAINDSYSSHENCKLLLEFDTNRESLQLRNIHGMIPLHCACQSGNIGTALYFLEMNPESINMTDDEEHNCLHILLAYRSTGRYFDFVEFSAGVIEFFGYLLSKDPGLIFSTTRDGDLPLHLVCKGDHSLSVTKFVYNTHPEAIYRRNNAGNTPLYEAQASYMYANGEQDSVIFFLQGQLTIANEAEIVTTPDAQGRLPIHRAMLNVNLPVGTLKLMMSTNHGSALVADKLGQTPLYVACQHCNMDVIKHLVDTHQHTLLIPDYFGDLPLHIACLYERFDVIEWILDRAGGGGVSIENDDGKLPIEMLLYEANCDRSSLEYVQAVYALLCAHPESVTHSHA